MKKATKISISVVLGLAALASIFTIIRLPYLKLLSNRQDYIYYVAYIFLWSMLETGFGIIAGSLHSLRKLISPYFHFDSSMGSSPQEHNTPYSGTGRAVITSHSVPAVRRTYRGEVGDNWEQLHDVEGLSSQKIYVKVDLEMQSLEMPQTPQESHGSREDLVHP
ncbi:hypothetical protein HYE67_000063 [Fusarium culmorum]|uniref:Rhodopsin domain-containing protein n=1 Tax=Fusarium culmorum TaxID=5516 RepID=A0A7S8CWV9_FUSCU|nr:hypothetical protein HYE67_000063 [Fusarium culmorum]